MDFILVPTATFRLLHVSIVMIHERRRIVQFNIPDSFAAAWTVHQLVNALSYDLKS